MNFLFHMLLSGADDQILVGNFMGDFVKGRLADRFPERTHSLVNFKTGQFMCYKTGKS